MLCPTRNTRNSANMVIESPLSRSTRRMRFLRSRAGQAGRRSPPPGSFAPPYPGVISAGSGGAAQEAVEHRARGQARGAGVDPHQRPFRLVDVRTEHEAHPAPAQPLVDAVEAAPGRLVLPVGDPELLPS